MTSLKDNETVKAYLDHYQAYLVAGGEEIPITDSRAAWERWQDEAEALWLAIPESIRLINGERNAELDALADAVNTQYRKKS